MLVQREDFDVAAEIARLTGARVDGGIDASLGIGAVATFTGYCRDEGGRLAALELEHYPGMAEAAIARVAAQAEARWPLAGLTIIHRFGRMAPGERIVLVAAASSHRAAAFEAASFMMDYLKTTAPFWKKEHVAEGGPAGWVEERQADVAAAQRWR